MKRYKILVDNSIFLFMGSLVSSGSIFASTVILARTFPMGDFGFIVYLLSIGGFFMMLFDMGISLAGTKFIAEFLSANRKREVGELISASLFATFILAIGALLILVITADFWIKDTFYSNLSFYLRIIALWVFSRMIIRALLSIFNGFQKMKYSAIFNGAVELINLIVLVFIVFVMYSRDVLHVICGRAAVFIIFPFLIGFTCLRFLHKQGINLRFGNFGYLKKVVRYGVFLLTPIYSLHIVRYISCIVIERLCNMADVGLFSVSYTISILPFLIITPLSYSLLPFVANHYHKKDIDTLKISIKVLLKYLGFGFFLVLMFVSFFSKQLLYLIYGAEYIRASNVLVVLAFALFFESFKVFSDFVLGGTANAKQVMFFDFAKFALILLFGLPLIAKFGLIGIASGLLVSFFVINIAKMVYLRKKVSIDIFSGFKIYLWLVPSLALTLYFKALVLPFLAILLFIVVKNLDKKEIFTIFNLVRKRKETFEVYGPGQ